MKGDIDEFFRVLEERAKKRVEETVKRIEDERNVVGRRTVEKGDKGIGRQPGKKRPMGNG